MMPSEGSFGLVFDVLKRNVPGSEGTVFYLTLMATTSYLDKQLSPKAYLSHLDRRMEVLDVMRQLTPIDQTLFHQ